MTSEQVIQLLINQMIETKMGVEIFKLATINHAQEKTVKGGMSAALVVSMFNQEYHNQLSA